MAPNFSNSLGPLASPSDWLQALGATISDIVWEDVTHDYSMVALDTIDQS